MNRHVSHSFHYKRSSVLAFDTTFFNLRVLFLTWMHIFTSRDFLFRFSFSVPANLKVLPANSILYKQKYKNHFWRYEYCTVIWNIPNVKRFRLNVKWWTFLLICQIAESDRRDVKASSLTLSYITWQLQTNSAYWDTWMILRSIIINGTIMQLTWSLDARGIVPNMY